MRFTVSAEVHAPATAGLRRAWKCVVPFLLMKFPSSSLSDLDIELRYVPIVMPADMLQRYPERSKLDRKRRIYDCAPQLEYDIFVSGRFEQQLNEYVRGIALSTAHLPELGATEEQVSSFKDILNSAANLQPSPC